MIICLYIPKSTDDALDTLNIVKCVGKLNLWVFQAANTLAHKKMRGCVQGVPEHQVKRVDFLVATDLGDEGLGVLLEDINVTKAVLDKLWSDELARVVP